MQLTQFTDYSLRALIYLAVHNERLFTVQEISQGFCISKNHMVKVVHNLAKEGYIESKKGKGGGIRLAKKPEEINLGEAVRRLEPDFYIAECFNCQKNRCKITLACKLKNVLFRAYRAFILELDQYTLADVTENQQELLELLAVEEKIYENAANRSVKQKRVGMVGQIIIEKEKKVDREEEIKENGSSPNKQRKRNHEIKKNP